MTKEELIQKIEKDALYDYTFKEKLNGQNRRPSDNDLKNHITAYALVSKCWLYDNYPEFKCSKKEPCVVICEPGVKFKAIKLIFSPYTPYENMVGTEDDRNQKSKCFYETYNPNTPIVKKEETSDETSDESIDKEKDS